MGILEKISVLNMLNLEHAIFILVGIPSRLLPTPIASFLSLELKGQSISGFQLPGLT